MSVTGFNRARREAAKRKVNGFDTLMAINKPKLIEYARETLGLEINERDRKEQIVDQIINAELNV